MVFRAVPFARLPKNSGSSSCELGSPPEFVVSASARSLSFPGAFHGVPFLFATSIQRVHLPTSVPGSSTFRPQRFARSRRLTPRSILQIYFTLLPRPGLRGGVAPPAKLYHLVGGHSLSPLPPRLCRRCCPTAPSRFASTSGRCSRPGSGARARAVNPGVVSISLRVCLPRTLAADLAPVMNRGSTLDLLAHRFECCARWPWRIDRPTASMLYR